jgi:hypothetical protein
MDQDFNLGILIQINKFDPNVHSIANLAVLDELTADKFNHEYAEKMKVYYAGKETRGMQDEAIGTNGLINPTTAGSYLINRSAISALIDYLGSNGIKVDLDQTKSLDKKFYLASNHKKLSGSEVYLHLIRTGKIEIPLEIKPHIKTLLENGFIESSPKYVVEDNISVFENKTELDKAGLYLVSLGMAKISKGHIQYLTREREAAGLFKNYDQRKLFAEKLYELVK